MEHFTLLQKWMKRFLGITALLVPVALTGCATTDRNVRLDYQPIVNAVGGKGELYVAISVEKDLLANRTDVEWVLGEMRDSDGKRTSKLLSLMAPKDLVTDAFVQELNAAGYKVRLVQSLPANVEKGLDFTGITLKLDEDVALVKVQAKGSLQVKVSVWKGGVLIKRLDFKNASSNTALRSDSTVLDKTLHDTVATFTRSAIPDVIREFENQ